jgi:hypothetical protein
MIVVRMGDDEVIRWWGGWKIMGLVDNGKDRR